MPVESSDERSEGWLAGCPRLVIALLLQLLFWLVQAALCPRGGQWWNWAVTVPGTIAYGAVLFVPGAIQRRKWGQILCAAAVGAAAPSLAHWIAAPAQTSQNLLFFPAWSLVVMLLVAFTEWILTDPNRWAPLAWMAVCCLAAAALDTAGFLGVRYGMMPEWLKPLLTAPLTALLTWSAIPVGQWLAARRRATQATAAAAIVAIVVGFVVLAEWGVYELARPSLRGDGPLTRLFAAMLLANRGSEDDCDLLLEELDRAAADGGEVEAWPELPDADWHRVAVKALVRQHKADAAKSLAKLVERHPSEQLLELCLDLFVEQRRYEVVPIVERYALVQESAYQGFSYVSSGRYTDALIKMRVPQSAAPLLVRMLFAGRGRERDEAMKADRPLSGPSVKDYTVPAEVREPLKALLGEDVGPQLKKWLEKYDRLVAEAPSPLSREQRRETDRVVKCMWKYAVAKGVWHAARMATAERMAEQQMREQGMAGELQNLRDFFAKNGKGKLPPADSDAGRALAHLGELSRRAYQRSLPEPNWNVPTTDALEAEVRAFIERAAKSMKKGP
jgi:hypothetical protein